MNGSLSAAQVHKQYDEAISAFRRHIAPAELRQQFGREADIFFCANARWGYGTPRGLPLPPVTWNITRPFIAREIPSPPHCSGSFPPP